MKTWIFQAVPEHYDLTEKVPPKINGMEDWSVTRYSAEMQSGDVVLLWQSGKAAGIYAVGKLAGEPYPTKTGKRRINIKYERLLPNPIYKSALKKIKELRQLSVIRQPRGTNFEVSTSEWRALQPIINDSRAFTKRRVAEDVEAEGAFDPKNEKDARERVLRSIVLRQGQADFRKRLLKCYGGRCLITGCNAVDALEAAHIQPYKGDHTNELSNGLLLRSDLHTLFDLRLLAVDPHTMKVLLSQKLKDTSYVEFEGVALKFPTKYRPNWEALALHLASAGL